MSSDRFHKAAKDGIVEILKEATRKDCNTRDEQGMTPTLYAAFYGHVDALRLLCARGGDPDKADLFGNTALHLASAQGHKHIVTFLVNFGANFFMTDIDGRTPQELAGINDKEDILRFLDSVTERMERDKKKGKSMKEKAKKESEKRIKEFNKWQAKQGLKQEKMEKKIHKNTLQQTKSMSMIETLKFRIKSGSMSNLSGIGQTVPRNSFSALVNGNTMSSGTGRTMSTIQRKVFARNRLANLDDDFKISEIEDGKRSIRSLKGYRRDSEVLYSGSIENKRGKLNGVFNEAENIDTLVERETPPPSSGLTRSLSQPDFMHNLHNDSEKNCQEPASIFVRPGIGSIAFRKSITHNFHGTFGQEMPTEESSIGSGDSNFGQRNNMISMEDELSDAESSEEEASNGPLERFLTAWGLGEYLQRFDEQKIDLETLMILTETDLKTLNLPLGPYRKLVTAISERKNALENPGEVTDSML